MINISIAQQSLMLQDKSRTFSFVISTSGFGIGNKEDSYQTPIGLHQVCDLIGLDEPIYTRFQDRVARGIFQPDTWDAMTDEDMILSRIIRLQGMVPGVNSGPGIDSFDRYIYIHGTHQENLLGTPASKGCIRMGNQDIIELCQAIKIGTLVNIER
jgi:hypothetical protein|tara:strand:- start:2788 stop:3255 length:468 start_codon:yes stop_codon:yes gene_type:complete